VTMSVEQFVEYVNDLAQCCLRDKLGFDPRDAAEVIFSGRDQGDYAEGSSAAIARMNDGSFVAVLDWEDTSGHGCQCGATAGVWPNLGQAVVMGLDEEWRTRYNAEKNPPPSILERFRSKEPPKEPELVRKVRRLIDALDL
jgi:hypothetical protein